MKRAGNVPLRLWRGGGYTPGDGRQVHAPKAHRQRQARTSESEGLKDRGGGRNQEYENKEAIKKSPNTKGEGDISLDQHTKNMRIVISISEKDLRSVTPHPEFQALGQNSVPFPTSRRGTHVTQRRTKCLSSIKDTKGG